jgi:hypothetical protein
VQPGFPKRIIMLPVSQMEGCEIIVTDRQEGGVSIDVRLQHQGADALMRYMMRGQFENAIIASAAVDAESLLQDKQKSPIGAAVGAYALLRLGELDRLHDWTGNLSDWFVDLPDGAVIRAEHLARRGAHDDALRTLLKVRERGVPIATPGLTYAINRLRQYIAVGPRGGDFDSQNRAIELLAFLDRFATIVDYRKPLLTYDPAELEDASP